MSSYQHYKSIKEKIEELTPWLKKLKENLTITAPGADPDEERRREELSR